MMHNKNEKIKFIFYRAFLTCPEPGTRDILAYTEEEATNLFKEKQFYITLNKCKKVERIFSEEDKEIRERFNSFYNKDCTKENDNMLKSLCKLNKEFYSKHKEESMNLYSTCIFNKLKVKIESQALCTINNNQDFDSLYLLNNTYLIGDFDGCFLVFKKSEETQNTHQKEEIIRNNTFTSPISTETHNYIPDDFFVKN